MSPAPPPAPHVPISKLLGQIAQSEAPTITVGDLLDHFGARAFGALMLVFGAPLALPMPPGISTVLGAPLVFITFQLMTGRGKLWLPKRVEASGVRHADFVRMCETVSPHLRRLEARLKPRLRFMVGPVGQRLMGALTFILALIVFLPIPFGNMAPALAIALMGLGLVERDGLAVLIGWIVSGLSLLLLALVSKAVVVGMVAFGKALLAPFF